MRRVDSIVREHGVAIGLAVESGSRAWGFPSPDRDYDCRFVFIRPLAQYLTPWPRRDVIELPLVDELDVNGWDLTKSLKLLMKGIGWTLITVRILENITELSLGPAAAIAVFVIVVVMSVTGLLNAVLRRLPTAVGERMQSGMGGG
jgi:hypothetical protein